MPRLVLIYASMGRAPGREFVESWKQEPLAMGVLSALTPDSWDVTFYDDRVEPIEYGVDADLVAIGIETYSARRGYQIAEKFRNRGIPVIFGGYHATLCPDECLNHGDSICVGEAEPVWHDVLEDVLVGKLRPRYQAQSPPSLEGIKVDRSIFEGKPYLELSLVETGRGCPFSCNFCSISSFYSSTYRRRPTQDIVTEVREVGNEYVFLVDDNLTGDLIGARELFAALKPLNKKWMTQTSVAGLNNKQLVKEMADSGCVAVLIGFESLDFNNLQKMDKAVNQLDRFSEILANLREAGIFVYGTFVFGYPHDTANLFDRTVDFAINEQMLIAAFNHLVPFPGTPLYRDLEAQGRMNYDKWWLSDDYYFGQVPFAPEQMSSEEVENRCLEARKRFYSFGSIFKRVLDRKCNAANFTNLAMYLSINKMLRREVTEKRGVRLGFENGQHDYTS